MYRFLRQRSKQLPFHSEHSHQSYLWLPGDMHSGEDRESRFVGIVVSSSPQIAFHRVLDLLPIAQLHRRIFQGLMLACQRSTLVHGCTVELVLAQLSFKQAYFHLNYQDLMVADPEFNWQETFASNL